MKKRAYITPSISCYRIEYTSCLLAGSNTKGAWTPGDDRDSNPQPPIDIKDETGGNLGGEGSEISGAKGNGNWGSWDD